MNLLIKKLLRSALVILLVFFMEVGVATVNTNKIDAESSAQLELIYGYGITPGGNKFNAIIPTKELTSYSFKGTYTGTAMADTGNNYTYQQYTTTTKNFNKIVGYDFYFGNAFKHVTSTGAVTIDGVKAVTSANFSGSTVYTVRLYTAWGNAMRDTKIINRYENEKTVQVKGSCVDLVTAANYYVTQYPDTNNYEFYIPAHKTSADGSNIYYSESNEENAISLTLVKKSTMDEVAEVDFTVGTTKVVFDDFNGTGFLRNNQFVKDTTYQDGDILKYSNGVVTFYKIDQDITIELIEKSDTTYTVAYHGLDDYGLTNPTSVEKNPGQTADDVNPMGDTVYADKDNKHYRFVGWYDSTLTTPYDFTQELSADVDLYAKFEECYLIKFVDINTLGGTNTSDFKFDKTTHVIAVTKDYYNATGTAVSTKVPLAFEQNVKSICLSDGTNSYTIDSTSLNTSLTTTGIFLGLDLQPNEEDAVVPKHETNLLKYAHSKTNGYDQYSWRFYNLQSDLTITFTNNVQISLQKSDESTPYSSFVIEKGTNLEANNENLIEPTIGEKEQLVNNKWYSDVTCQNEYVFGNAVNESITLYANVNRQYVITVKNAGLENTKAITSSQIEGIATLNSDGDVLTLDSAYHSTTGFAISVNAPALGNSTTDVPTKIVFKYKGVTSQLTSGTNPIVVTSGRYLTATGSLSSSSTPATDVFKYAHSSGKTLYSFRFYNIEDDLEIEFMPDVTYTATFNNANGTEFETVENIKWNNTFAAPDGSTIENFRGWYYYNETTGNAVKYETTSHITGNVTYSAECSTTKYSVEVNHSTGCGFVQEDFSGILTSEYKALNSKITGKVIAGLQDPNAKNVRYSQLNGYNTISSIDVKVGTTDLTPIDCEAVKTAGSTANFLLYNNDGVYSIGQGTTPAAGSGIVVARISVQADVIFIRLVDVDNNLTFKINYLDDVLTNILTGMDLNNNSTLALNYKVTLPDGVNASNCRAKVGDEYIALSSLTANLDGSYNIKATNLAAKNMNDKVAMQIEVLSEGETYVPITNPVSISAKDYLVAVINSSEYDQDMKDFCKSMLTYGAYSQIYFDHDITNLVNAGYEVDVSGVTANVSNNETIVQDSTDVNLYGISLTLNDIISLNLYLTFKDDAVGDYSVYHGETSLEANDKGGSSNGRKTYCFTAEGCCAAPDLSTMQTFTVKKGNDVVYTITWNPLTYCNKIINKYGSNAEKVNIVNLCKSIYMYSAAADNLTLVK